MRKVFIALAHLAPILLIVALLAIAV